jgi:hypothetical protein
MIDSISVYDFVTGGAENYVELNESRPSPTKEDYQKGFITRYFIKRTNQFPGEVMEISKNTFDRLTGNAFYVTIQIPWKITGPKDDYIDTSSFIKMVHGVTNSNQATIQEFVSQIPELRYKLPDLLQFWRGS